MCFFATISTFTPAFPPRTLKGGDSFKNIEIIMATEEKFAMKFSSSELDKLTKLGDLVAIVAVRGKSPT